MHRDCTEGILGLEVIDNLDPQGVVRPPTDPVYPLELGFKMEYPRQTAVNSPTRLQECRRVYLKNPRCHL